VVPCARCHTAVALSILTSQSKTAGRADYAATVAQTAFAPDVFTWPADEPQLISSKCPQCAAVTFPQQSTCPRCGSREMARHLLPRRGTLWTFTTQEFLPKEPYASGETVETFAPYGVGMVQLGDEVRVESRLTEADPDVLRIGMEVELVVVPFRVDDDGTEIMTYAFRPT
jgi:uncharacterized OB-fold protein